MKNYYEVKDFTGANFNGDSHVIDDSEATDLLNVQVAPGQVEIRPGYDLWNKDTTNGSGGIKYMFPFYKTTFTNATNQLIFANADKWKYQVAGAVTDDAFVAIGDYGTEVDNPRGIVYNDICILGSNNSSNNLKKWSGSAFSNTTSEPTDNVNMFDVWVGEDDEYLLAAEEGTSTLWYSNSADGDKWTGSDFQIIGKNNGEQIRGIKARLGEALIYKDNRKYKRSIVYEAFSGDYVPKRTGGSDGSGGTLAHDSMVSVDESIYCLTNRTEGFQSFGPRSNFDGDNIPYTISKKISPILKNFSWNYIHKTRGIRWGDRVLWALPFHGSKFNSKVVVYDLIQKGWSFWDMPVGAFSKFKDTNGHEMLLMGDSGNPIIYKFNEDIYSDNLLGYQRVWQTKAFDFGDRLGLKPVKWIDIGGSMADITNLKVTVNVDGNEVDYMITRSQILTRKGGTSIGDNLIGKEIVGGNSTSDSKLRYIAQIDIGNIQRLGHSIKLKFSNNGSGEYWKIDYLGFDFEKSRVGVMPRRPKHTLSPLS